MRLIRRAWVCFVLSLLVIMNIIIGLQQLAGYVAGGPTAAGADWYTINNGWINVTKSSYRWAARNGSVPTEFMFFYRYSNSIPFQSSEFGFIWTELLYITSTFKGRGTAYIVYNDTDILIYKRVQSESGATITQYYTFWRDKEYWAWSSEINVPSTSASIEQNQVGIYTLWQSGWTYQYRSMDYHNNSYISSDSVTGDHGSNLPVTQGVIENNTAFPWQVERSSQNNETVGWISTYHSEPWWGIDPGAGSAAGEIQYSSYCMNPVIGTSIRLKLPYTKRIDTIVYPYYGDDNNWHMPTKQLAEELYSTVTKTQSWASLEYAYAQHDVTSGLRTGQIANKIGIFLFGRSDEGGFLLKNTTVWNYYPSIGSYKPLPLHFYPYGNPFVGFTNSTGQYFASGDFSPTRYDTSSQSISTDSTKVRISWKWVDKNAQGNLTMETWGDSDKFNVTIYFKNTITTNIIDAYTNMRAINQINNIQFNEITADTTADYTIADPYGGYGGYLIKVLEGNHSWVDFSGSGMKIYFIDNSAQQQYSPSTRYVKLMFWAHFGQITSESEITGYHTAPSLANVQQHFAKSAVNSSLFTPYDVWAASSTFPIMRQVNSTTYKLLAIGSGTRTFTIFLNTTAFPRIKSVSNVSSYEYNRSTGNFTFTVAFSSGKWIHINVLALEGDVSGNGIVNIEDLFMIAIAFGTHEGDPGYDAELDLNHDGSIDGGDLSIVDRDYGNTC